MELQELYALMERFQASGLTRLEWKRENGEKLTLSCESYESRPSHAQPPAAVPVMASVGEQAAESLPQDPDPADIVAAPLVGVFYAAPSPDAEPFAVPGKRVKKGDTLCILEAMKMMSEVPAPADCVIEEVLVQDAQPVGYGDALFRIRRIPPCSNGC